MFVLVCFDIVDDRVRYRAVKILKTFGVRVQKSVFECANLTEKQFLTLMDRMEETVDQVEDSVRYYVICKSCLEKMEFTGLGDPPMTEEFKIV